MPRSSSPFAVLARAFLTTLVLAVSVSSATAWWDKEWTIRKKITIDTSAAGAAITDPIGTATVLVRLHDGNFQFLSAKEDGTDIRFVAEDDKTLLPFHIERYDGLLNEAFVWVRVNDVKPGGQTSFWLYYGSSGPKATRADDAKGSYPPETSLVYHFAESGAPAADSTGNANAAQGPGVPAQGAMIGGGVKFDGKNTLTTPASASLQWTQGAAFTWSAWVKAATLAPNTVVFSRRDEGRAIVVGANDGVPYVEITNAAGTQRTAAGTAIAAGAWKHLAVVSDGNKATLFLDGDIYASIDAQTPALNSPLTVGGDSLENATGFSGDIDELQVSKVALPSGLVKFAATNQGSTDKAAKLVAMAPEEIAGAKGSAALEHVMLFGDIAKNMMFDGWIAIGVCVLMIIFGWGVAIRKFNYLNSIQKGTEAFLKQWKNVSSDLTILDHDDEQNVKSMGGKLDAKTMRDMHRSPLFHLYHIGSEEIRGRVGKGKDRSKGLSARSIQAIRASLESGLVRENQRMNKGLVFLTISIAGGPYVGLLGTVVGVMITFAIIA
jgi:biopolymer transport protein ExbB